MTKKEIIKEMLNLNERLLNRCKNDETIHNEEIDHSIEMIFEYLWDLDEIIE